jgi:hypothetical protein
MNRLEELDLHQTSVSDEGVIEISKSGAMARLRRVNLSMNWSSITDLSLIRLAYSGMPL